MGMDPKRKLKGLLARIFSNAVVDEGERGELLDFLAEGALSQDERLEVVREFVATTWKMTNADGVVSDTERSRLKEIVRVLALEPEMLPEAWSRIVRDA